MAKVVLGVGSSHAPMINSTLEEWVAMKPRESGRMMHDREGNLVSYEELVEQAAGRYDKELAPEILTARYQAIQAALDQLVVTIRDARLDTLIVIGDDQRELFLDDNLPSMLVYCGERIKNEKRAPKKQWVDWYASVQSRFYNPADMPSDFSVNRELALHLTSELVEEGFDLSISRHLPRDEGEGHAIAFVHQRLFGFADMVPIVPFFINTYFPPNQPTPRRCFQLGKALRSAVERYPKDLRVGVLASGGLSHFSVDEELDQQALTAITAHDEEAIAAIPRNKLQSGNSEMRNWFAMSGATAHLERKSMEYIPTYRTPGGTGTGTCFASWS